MRKTISFLSILLLLSTDPAFNQTGKPDAAQNILKAAIGDARSSKKNVMLLFHATWCTWCKRLEAALESPDIKPIIAKNFILVKLDVKERGEKIQTHENPGGNELLANFEGAQSGLPYIVFLNNKGKMIANSNGMPNNQNIGYPGTKEEIAALIKLLKQTAPRMTDKERHKILKYLERNAPQ